ncbi:MAG: transposase [Accumulibacter sp.]|jgi:hypothetical protein
MGKGLRGFVDDALARTGPLAVEKSGDFPTARPFAHKLHRALFGSDKIPEGQNQPHHRSADRNWQGSTYRRAFAVQTSGATSPSPPADAEPLEWFLITTCEITTPEQAQECLRWYCLRWRIEDWHRVLKSGCRIEALQHKTAERLKRAIAINLVIAWRIMLMTLLGRQCPDLPAEVLFSDAEIEVLQAYAKKNKSPSPLGSATPFVS